MASVTPQAPQLVIRSVQYRDLGELEQFSDSREEEGSHSSVSAQKQFEQLRRWYALLKLLSLLPNPLRKRFSTHVAEYDGRLCGLIQVSPFNCTRSTWRVERVSVRPQGLNAAAAADSGELKLSSDIGSQLLRYCFEKIWEARTWLIEVNVNDKEAMALYRQNGFQPLAHLTYWAIAPEQLQALANHEPDLPNLLPISNADAQLLYQLDTASVPPLVRQVFDHQIQDFKTNLMGSLVDTLQQWVTHTEVASGYVFEPQRKAAIGYFWLRLSRNGTTPHVAKLTVHPAYTWLYPELLAQMARITQNFPAQSLHLISADYHSEREEYLTQIGANQVEHTLMMSRSVWHKLREAKPVSLDGLQLSDVLQGLQPARKPVPGRMSWRMQLSQPAQKPSPESSSADSQSASGPNAGFNRSSSERSPHHSGQLPDLPQSGPPC